VTAASASRTALDPAALAAARFRIQGALVAGCVAVAVWILVLRRASIRAAIRPSGAAA